MANPTDTMSDSAVKSLTSHPPAPDQYFVNSHYSGPEKIQTSEFNSNPLTPSQSIPPTPGSVAGRKRSRGDILAPEDEDIQPDGSLPTPADEDAFGSRINPVPGPGMTLINPDHPGYPAAAESQSGTWVEENIDRKAFELQHTKRPSTSSRKSQRLGTGASDADALAQLVLPPQMREATVEPLIDEATRVLGISWTRMDSSEALLINQAAYNKFIQNHYSSLKDVAVWFENCALPGYLVVASNAYSGRKEFYLFSHDLSEARLVTRDPADLLPRLKLLPALHLAAPGGQLRAETDSATAAQNEINNVLQDSALESGALNGGIQPDVCPRPRSIDPARRYRELLCTAHEMELD